MTSIERTAYPCISASKVIAQKTLEKCYVLTPRELEYIDTYIHGNRLRGTFAVQLKVFQSLGYFVDMKEVPISIVGFYKKTTQTPPQLPQFCWAEDDSAILMREPIAVKVARCGS